MAQDTNDGEASAAGKLSRLRFLIIYRWWTAGVSLAGIMWVLSAWVMPIRSSGSLADELARYPVFQKPSSTDRLTIVAPHLDDESIGLGGLIAGARQQGIPVSVIFMTNGDHNPVGADMQFKTAYPRPEQLIESGISRQAEAIQAAKQLGVPEDRLYFLGLPDRGLREVTSAKYETSPFTAPGTLKNNSPYAHSYIPGLPYTGEATRSALKKAIEQTRPTLVFTTLPEDRHQDHAATGELVASLLPQLNNKPALYYFLIHYSRFPNPGGIDETKPLLPPAKLENRSWKVIIYSSDDLAKKKEAIAAYQSQLRIPQLGRLMRALTRSNELVIPAE